MERIIVLFLFLSVVAGSGCRPKNRSSVKEEMEFSKDNPLIFIKCAERLNEAISNIIVFEDALHCIKSAKAAGFKVIGVYDKANEKDMDKISEYSDMYIKSFEELL